MRHRAVRPKVDWVLRPLAHRILGHTYIDVVRAPDFDLDVGGVECGGGQSPCEHRADEAGLEAHAEVHVARTLLFVGRGSQGEESAVLGFGGTAATSKAMSGRRERGGGYTHM